MVEDGDTQANKSDTGGEEAPVVSEKSEADIVKADREALKTENDAFEKEQLRSEQLRAEKQRGGRSEAGQETTDKTQDEKDEEAAKDFMQDDG